MARNYAKVNTTIWTDPDFRNLPPAAQHLYLLLWTSPDLSFCGTHDWRPARLTHLSEGFTAEHTATVADCLQARHFLVVDTDTEEVLVRSWARFDEVMKQPRLAVSYVKAYSSVYSSKLRKVLVNEAQKMRHLWPELPCWKDDRVKEVLGHPAVSAKDLPIPEDPFGGQFGSPLALGLAQTLPSVSGSVSVPPTTAPATASKPLVVEGGVGGGDSMPRKRGTQLPEDWEPTEAHAAIAAEEQVDLDREATKFRDHYAANGKVMKDWNATFRNWLRNDQYRPKPPPGQLRTIPHASQLEDPPEGMTAEEEREWHRARARSLR